MQLKTLAASLTAAVLLGGASVVVADPPNFDFNGYAQFPVGKSGIVPAGAGMTMASVLTNNGVVPTPIPLNFALNQYTLIVQGSLANVIGNAQHWTATIQIYEDPIGGGTAANYANLATFVDGTLILGGAFDGFLTRNTFTANLGNFVGKVDFASGTMLGALPTPQDWPFGGAWSRTVSGIPAGFAENWDGLIDMAPVAVESRPWSGVKALYQH
jgi:hypothetical protein